MIKVILNGKYMSSKDYVHLYMKYELNIKDYYGGNLDALWDALSTYNKPMKVSLINKDILIDNLGEYGHSIIKVFEDARESNPNIDFQIK